jgi:hypothetical protein
MWLQILATRLQRREWERERRKWEKFGQHGVALRKILSNEEGRPFF